MILGVKGLKYSELHKFLPLGTLMIQLSVLVLFPPFSSLFFSNFLSRVGVIIDLRLVMHVSWTAEITYHQNKCNL